MNRIRLLLPLSLLLSMVAGVLTVPWSASAEAASKSQFACDTTDAPDKGWVLPIYVHQPGQDKYDADLGALLNAIWETDQTFDASAQRFEISRRIRFLQDGDCRPVVAKLPFVKGRNRAEMSKALGENLAAQPALVRKLWPTNRVKPLFFVRDNDITNSCTGGGADAGLSNGGAILPRWCWGEAGLTHELLHTFGLSHCNDDPKNGNDPLCRNSGSKPECKSDAASNYHLDSCRIDEFRYFEPTPVKQPPLAKNRNVAFSPYLIQDQPSPVWNLRLKAVDNGKCLDDSGQQVVQRSCADTKNQTWQRSIDADGYLTIRNAGTGECLKMADTVTTEKCVAKERSQQWLPQAEQERTSFVSRAGGRLSVKDKSDGALAVRDAGGTVVAELLGGTTAASAPAKNPEATTTPTPTRTPEPSTAPTMAPEPLPSAGPQARTVGFKSSYGTCLTATRTQASLKACPTKWRVVPVARGAVQLRYGSGCLALGPARQGKRAVVLTACRGTAKGQRWLLESQQDGTATVKSATTKATRLVGLPAGKSARVYAKAAYTKNALRFVIR
ncbi:ricin-type beta-trefoil lectin domain protein [Nonomuraea jabiensis]|uniref:RICIN domain-containing protein n=1 Tax=Nonomuraea jabiensis TaxID=882448 RepID=UPI0034456246